MSEEPQGQKPGLEGQTLGQYEIIRKLGEGGMATVYLARQPSIGRMVAIKVLPPHFMHDDTFMQRFEHEVRIAADLQHPRVLPIYDYGELEGRPYIVMAYLGGGSLADRIREGAIPLEDTVKIVNQIAEGLDHAHARGVVHRDFKPSNVLLDEHGNAYLADFGIAKITESTVNLTGTGIVGTPAYMAPEMGSEGIVAPSVDVYALGITLYQMLTGKCPYSGETPLSVLMAHVTSPIPDVRSERPDLPDGVARVLERAMAKKPQDRYATAGELAAAWQAAVAAAGSDARYAATSAVPSEQTPPPVAPAPPVTPAPPATSESDWQSAPSPMPRVRSEAPQAAPPPPQRAASDEWYSSPSSPPPVNVPAAAPPAAPAKRRGGLGITALVIAGVLGLMLIACIAGFFLLGGPRLLGLGTPEVAEVTEEPGSGLIVTEAVAPTEEVVVVEEPTQAPAVPTATTEVQQPTEPAAGGLSSLTIDNQTSTVVCYVRLSPSDSEEWGDDQLGDTETIASGSSYTIWDVPAGEYDYQALDCNQVVLDEHYGVYLDEAGFNWTLRDATDWVTVINNSSFAVCGLYVSSLEDSRWGVNRLGEGGVIDIGGQTTVSIASGTYDLRADGCDGETYWEEYERPVNGGHEWTLTD